MTSPGSPDPQSAVRAARDRLLQGRGVGASGAEVDARTREQPRYAGKPVSEQLEGLHERTAIARGDIAAVRRDVDRTRNHLAPSLDTVASRVDPRRHRPRASPVVAAFAVGLLVVLRCRRHR